MAILEKTHGKAATMKHLEERLEELLRLLKTGKVRQCFIAADLQRDDGQEGVQSTMVLNKSQELRIAFMDAVFDSLEEVIGDGEQQQRERQARVEPGELKH